MKKKTTETTKQQQHESVVEGFTVSTPSYIDELMKNGTVTLTAKTRDELVEIVNNIPANVHYGAGAVAHSTETGVFLLRVDISKS